MSRARFASLLTCCAIAATTISTSLFAGTPNSYVEDFSTDTYRNSAQTTVDWNTGLGELRLREFTPGLVGSHFGSGSIGITLSGDYAFLCDKLAGLKVLSISDPESPYLLGYWTRPGYEARGAAARGDNLFLAAGDYFVTLDVSNPFSPSFLDEDSVGAGSARDVTLHGKYAYVAAHNKGLFVYDVSDPASIQLIAREDTVYGAQEIAISGNRAYIAASSHGLWVFDIGNPASPLAVTRFPTLGTAYGVVVDGDYLFVADGGAGLTIVNISDPSAPSIISTTDTPGTATKIAVAGDWAYVADASGGVHFLDTRNPFSPIVVSTIDTPDNAFDIALDGNHAYVADLSGGLQVVQIAVNEPNLIQLSTFVSSGYANYISTFGDYALLGDCFDGVQVLDISNASNPQHVTTFNTPDCAGRIVIEGDIAYVANQGYFSVMDVSTPDAPSNAGGIDLNFVQQIIVDGDLCFLSGANDVHIVDVSVPSNPSILSTSNFNPVGGIALHGNTLLVCVISRSIEVLDVTNPSQPVSLGQLSMSGVGSIVLHGDLGFVSRGNLGLTVVDVSDPAALLEVATVPVSQGAMGATIDGNRLFLVDGDTLQVYDISVPSAPLKLFGRRTTNPPSGSPPTVFGDLLYVPGRSTDSLVTGTVDIFRFSNRFFEAGAGVATSTLITTTVDNISALRLTASPQDSIRWEVSPDGLNDWRSIQADNRWYGMEPFGSTLYWRSNHTSTEPTTNPTCSSLRIDWLFRAPTITSVSDYPLDQGGFVTLSWFRSGMIFTQGDSVTAYQVYRPESQAGTNSRAVAPIASTPPPTGWTLAMTLPADDRDSYQLVFPTAADSSLASAPMNLFLVRAVTALGVVVDSRPDSGYSVDNLPPAPPAAVAAIYLSGVGNNLIWTPSVDSDVIFYKIYRSTDPDFDPTSQNFLHITADIYWADAVVDGWLYTYKISAVDQSFQEGEFTSSGSATGASNPPPGLSFNLQQNVPNPFNPTTTIGYTIGPVATHVELTVFDVDGRAVRNLVSRQQSPGHHAATWDGRNDKGQLVATGVYFCRLTAGRFLQTRKLSLIK